MIRGNLGRAGGPTLKSFLDPVLVAVVAAAVVNNEEDD